MPTFRELFLPYCLQRQADGRYAVLNRLYKPVGLSTPKSTWVDYQDPHLVHMRGLTPAAARLLSWEGKDATDTIYLYNDGCVPTDSAPAWRSYAERLNRLAKMKTEP